MGRSILVTGGARSGKSAIAERLTLELGGDPVYIATAEAGDAEMAARIALHRDRRGSNWTTREVPLHLAEALHATDGAGPRLVDCLTLWLSNLMLAGGDWQRASQSLAGERPRAGLPRRRRTAESVRGGGLAGGLPGSGWHPRQSEVERRLRPAERPGRLAMRCRSRRRRDCRPDHGGPIPRGRGNAPSL